MHDRHLEFEVPTTPPTIEFDQKVRGWYLRFSKGKIAKTISEERRGFVWAIDLDSRNKVVGLELIGMEDFTIKKLKAISPIDTSKIDFDRAVFCPASA